MIGSNRLYLIFSYSHHKSEDRIRKALKKSLRNVSQGKTEFSRMGIRLLAHNQLYSNHQSCYIYQDPKMVTPVYNSLGKHIEYGTTRHEPSQILACISFDHSKATITYKLFHRCSILGNIKKSVLDQLTTPSPANVPGPGLK